MPFQGFAETVRVEREVESMPKATSPFPSRDYDQHGDIDLASPAADVHYNQRVAARRATEWERAEAKRKIEADMTPIKQTIREQGFQRPMVTEGRSHTGPVWKSAREIAKNAFNRGHTQRKKGRWIPS